MMNSSAPDRADTHKRNSLACFVQRQLSGLAVPGLMVIACSNASLFAAEAPAGKLDTAPAFNQGASLIQPRTEAVLPADSAFALSALVEADSSIVLMWDIRPGYYLYQKSLAVETASGTRLSSLALPDAVEVTDEFFGTVAVYYDRLLLRIPLQELDARPGATLELLLIYQGCAEDLYCYPPQHQAVSLTLPE